MADSEDHGTRSVVNSKLTLAELYALLDVDEIRPNGAVYGWCPTHENPHAFRVRIARRTFDGFVKVEGMGCGCREATIASALSLRTGRTITADDLLTIVMEPVG